MMTDLQVIDVEVLDLDDARDIHEPEALRRRSAACSAIHDRLAFAVRLLGCRSSLALLRARNRAEGEAARLEQRIALLPRAAHRAAASE